MSDLRDLLERGVRGFHPDPGDALDTTRRRAERRHRNRRVLAGVVALALVAGSFGTLWTLLRDEAGPRPGLEPGPEGILSLDIGYPTSLTSGFGSVWVGVTDPRIGEGRAVAGVARLDPRSGEVLATVETGAQFPVQELAAGGGAIWAVDPLTPAIHRIDPATNRLAGSIDLGTLPERFVPGPIAATSEVIRVADVMSNEVARVDPESGTVVAVDVLPTGPVEHMRSSGDGIWTLTAHEVSRFDGAAGHASFAARFLTDQARALAVGGDGPYVAWRSQGIRTAEGGSVFSWERRLRVTGLEVVGDRIWATTEERKISEGMHLWSLSLDGEQVSGPAHIGATKTAGGSHVADALTSVGRWLWAVDGDSNRVLRIDTLDPPSPASSSEQEGMPSEGSCAAPPAIEAEYVPESIHPRRPRPGMGEGADPDGRFTNVVHWGDSPGPEGDPAPFLEAWAVDPGGGPLIPASFAENRGTAVQVLGETGYLVHIEDGWGVFAAFGDGPCEAIEIHAYGPSRAETRRFAEGLKPSRRLVGPPEG